MSVKILMPSLSPTMTEGNLTKWLVKEGDLIKSGDVIAEIETDKATMEVETVDEGVIEKLLYKEGEQSIPVNSTIAILSGDNNEEEKNKDLPEQPKDNEDSSISTNNIVQKSSLKENKQNIDTSLDENLITMRQAIRDAMAEEMRKNESVFVIGEEVGEYQGAYKVTQGLLEEFGPKRIIDTPISEQGFTGLAVGSAFKGLRPIVEFMTFNFSMQAIDQIINSAAKTLYMSGGQINCPIVFRGPNGAASQVAAQHSQDFTSWYAHCPGLKVVVPSNAYNAKGLLKSAIDDDNPVIFLENEILYGHKAEVPADTNFEIPLGVANIALEGSDATIVTYSIMVSKSLEAAKLLKYKHDINVEVIDLQTIRPLDKITIIESVKKTNRLVTVEESWPFASIGSEIVNIVQNEAFDFLDSPIKKINSADVPMPYSSVLEKKYLPQVEDIILAIEEVCYIQ
ncbi:MAG: pyruvate dehydrogenase complex E1 component subunit beta [Alphaproteobacteria bacterium]|nr:pyruvate dehydrogenase complex E1 component subunit beta [Alphaproteobacteria bacterium]